MVYLVLNFNKMKQTKITIDLDLLDQEIKNYDAHRAFLAKSLEENPTQAKRTYLKELIAEQEALVTFKKLYGKFSSIPKEDKPWITCAIPGKLVREVKVVNLFRDSGSRDVVDKKGIKYHLPAFNRNPRYGHYGDLPKEACINVPKNIEFKIVEEFS